MLINYDFSKYKSIIFDCDGVVLDSNKVKTDAFYSTVLPYGEELAKAFVSYHKMHGGVSRYKKFSYFLSEIVDKEIDGLGYKTLLSNYAKEVFNGMLNCNQAKGLDELKEKTQEANWLIASGGDQEELRRIFSQRHLKELFDGGIFGSPDTKETIFEKGLIDGKIKTPALFLGDSKYDYMASQKFEGIDFIFLSDWTEVEDWEQWCNEFNISRGVNILDLLVKMHFTKRS